MEFAHGVIGCLSIGAPAAARAVAQGGGRLAEVPEKNKNKIYTLKEHCRSRAGMEEDFGKSWRWAEAALSLGERGDGRNGSRRVHSKMAAARLSNSPLRQGAEQPATPGRSARGRLLKTTRYFDEQVLRKRPYLTIETCMAVIGAPIHRTVQEDGRIRHWGKVPLSPDGKARILRVVTLADGETIHNAFYDRDFRKEDE
jgi:hypothetical protein